MATIGILTCEILELEISYVLKSDKEINRIIVLENSHSLRLIESLELEGAGHLERITDLNSFTPAFGSELEVVVHVLELGLQNHRHLLQKGISEAACWLGKCADALLLG